MKNEITPGPWRVVTGCVLDQHNNIVASRHAMEVLNPETGETKRCGHDKPHISPVEADNNCHLLAASREMLDMLEEFMRNYKLIENCQINVDYAQLAHLYSMKIESIIAKARRSP